MLSLTELTRSLERDYLLPKGNFSFLERDYSLAEGGMTPDKVLRLRHGKHVQLHKTLDHAYRVTQFLENWKLNSF